MQQQVNPEKLILLKTRYDAHVSASTIAGLEKTFIKFFQCKETPQQPLRKILKPLYQASGKSTFLRKIIDKLFSLISTRSRYFLAMMGIDQIRKSYPYFLFTARSKSVYLFDCWEKKFKKTEELIIRHNIQTIFFSAGQAAAHFQKKFACRNCAWVPEAINADEYRYLPPDQKTIDIIQIGRKYDAYHERIVPFCEERKLKYLFEKTKGEVIFPDNNDFRDALAQSKISICFPSSITHPERSGNISTMTVRYLQSMASKCLVIGSMPEDMKMLFDYSPVIEADMNDPAKQLETILSTYKEFIPLVEKNYTEVRLKHQWINRMEIFKKYVGN